MITKIPALGLSVTNPYETEELLNQYLLFHYGSSEEILPYDAGPKAALNFAARTVREILPLTAPAGSNGGSHRALDLGCAVGRSTFELSKHLEEVVGIDASSAFIKAANTLLHEGTLVYRRIDEGDSSTQLVARLPTGTHANRVTFEVGDAMNLRADLEPFDFVHAANLLCRLPKPKKFLARLPSLVIPGGYLVLTSPCTWTEQYTPKRNWPKTSTLDFLKENLGGAFELKKTLDMPFLIREHARKFQWSVALGTLWKRKNAL